MKYFVNFPYTAESLKSEYRELCKKLHPDTGGNAQDFAEMMNEYEQVTNDLNRANEEAAAREQMARAAEEARRRREQEEREEEARKAAARPLYEKKCNKWAHLMEDLNPYRQAEADAVKLHGWSSQEARAAGSAYRAARRRNLVAMAKAAFPGVKFSASINTGWGGGATISWHEGPTVEELKAATDYEIFISGWDTFDGMTDCAGYERADFTEFANNYGNFSGCVSYERTEDKEHREHVADIICSVKPSAAEQRAKDGRREDCTVFLSNEDITKICSLLDIDADKFKKAHSIYGTWGESKFFELFVEWFTKWSHYTPQPKAPEFAPKYGPTYKAIKKALGGNIFGIRKTSEIKDIFALCDDLTGLEIGKIFVWDGKKEFSGMYSSSRKNTATRIEKMQSVGITLDRAGEGVQAVAEEVREALRREREDIERQRKEWEQAQQEGAKANKGKKAAKTDNTKQESKQADSDRDGVDMTAAPAEGLRLIETADGVAVVADDWKTTYFNKKYIKAHGAHWNKDRKQWEATEPQDIDALRAWFFFHGKPTDQGATIEDVTTEDEPQTESEQADTLEQAGDITDTTTDTTDESEPEALRGATLQEIERKSDRTAAPAWLKPGATFKRTTNDGREVVAICTRLLLDGFAYITANGCGIVDHVAAFAGYNFDGLTPCDIDDSAPEFARMLRNFQRIRKGFEEYQTAHPYTTNKTDNEQGDTLEQGDEITANASEEQQQAGELSPLFCALGDFLTIVADIMQQAQRWEGVTIPAATLEKWKQEAAAGTKTAAARFCEVCACLGSLTPESRRDFDALGAIFWSLSEQLKQGAAPETISSATEYARRQLFELIGRTQTANQARAVQEATDPDSMQRAA